MAFLHTYSIVARDKETSQLGVAVQTHWFAVGAMCPWIEAGVGAVATQSMVEVSYGPKSLALLKKGAKPGDVLKKLLDQDKGRALRQVAIIDINGNLATHTGNRCIREAGHSQGDNFSVQANMMLNENVWPAMAAAFEGSKGKLSHRMLAALTAGQSAGGDIRGMQSAAMLVADCEKSEEPWKHELINIRVDDHPKPLAELKRLLLIHEAYDHMNRGDSHLEKRNFSGASVEYQKAFDLLPENEEIPFWHAVSLVEKGKMEEALSLFKKLFLENPNWYELALRLPESDLMKADQQQIAQITQLMKSLQ